MWEYLKELRSQLKPVESVVLCVLAFALLLIVGALPELTRERYMSSAILGALIWVAVAFVISAWKDDRR